MRDVSKFLCISLSPTIQRTVSFKSFRKNEVNRSCSYRMDASGKAVNSARVLNQLEKGCVRIVCPLGKENLATFNNLAVNDGLPIHSVETPGRTRECWTLLDKSDSGTTELVVSEPSDVYNYSESEEKLLKAIEEELEICDAVLLAGSSPSYFKRGLVPCIAKIISQHKKLFLADYCGENLTETFAFCVPEIIKINHEEFCSAFDYPIFMSEENLESAIKEKAKELKNILIITRGKKSTLAANYLNNEKGEFIEFPCENVKAVNTTACGDSFSAGFLYEFAKTKNFQESLAKGTWCAARNAESVVPGSVF